MNRYLATAGLGVTVAVVGLALAPAAGAATLARPTTTTTAPTAVTTSATATHAVAHPDGVGCYSSGCNGLNPVAEGCSTDAYTVTSISTAEGYVELRYSTACDANWARISGASAGAWFWAQDCVDGYNQQYYVPSGYTSAYTGMVDGAVTARAGDSDGYTSCY